MQGSGQDVREWSGCKGVVRMQGSGQDLREWSGFKAFKHCQLQILPSLL